MKLMINKILIVLLLFLSTNSYGQSLKQDYTALTQEILAKRKDFNNLYSNADSSEKAILIIQAREFLLDIIPNKIFPHWYGTRWDFNGMTRIPRKNTIACGYFVTNILTDIGYNIPRIKWAQSQSEVFIKKLAPNKLKRFLNKPLQEVEDYLLKKKNALYLVGLDTHVGFILVKDGTIKFIHSNYYQPEIGVMSEDIHTDNPLKDSSYRIIGLLLSDKMVFNWINNSKYE